MASPSRCAHVERSVSHHVHLLLKDYARSVAFYYCSLLPLLQNEDSLKRAQGRCAFPHWIDCSPVLIIIPAAFTLSLLVYLSFHNSHYTPFEDMYILHAPFHLCRSEGSIASGSENLTRSEYWNSSGLFVSNDKDNFSKIAEI